MKFLFECVNCGESLGKVSKKQARDHIEECNVENQKVGEKETGESNYYDDE